MKFDRIALKITFFVFISGLILMSNVAMSQTPVVDSSEHSSGYSSYEEGQVSTLQNRAYRTWRNYPAEVFTRR